MMNRIKHFKVRFSSGSIYYRTIIKFGPYYSPTKICDPLPSQYGQQLVVGSTLFDILLLAV